jgi:hypothetical protein
MALGIALWLLGNTTMRKAWGLLFTMVLSGSCVAQPHDRTPESALIVYKIQAGDTLIQLSRKYLKQPADLEAIRHLNHLRNIDLLPTGDFLKIPRAYVKQSPSQATIISLSCARPIRAGTPLRPMSMGSVLNEGAIIDIPAECHVSMMLEDSSVIRLPSSAAVKISTLRKNALESSPEVQLDLVRGRIELEVYKGRAQTTPFEVRTPLSITGVRGTEFRVGYAPTEQTGQVEVLGGVVQAMGLSDAESRAIKKGQGVPFDSSGKALPIEQLLSAPVFERAELVNRTQSTYNIKLIGRSQAKHFVAISSKSANFLGEHASQILRTPEVTVANLTSSATFYQLTAVSQAGLVGTPHQYGFCTAQGEVKAGRCKAVFDAPMSENVMITFSLTREVQGGTQELVSTQKLQARNGQFAIEGLPSGSYKWNMSYGTSQALTSSMITKQSGSFDLIALVATPP